MVVRVAVVANSLAGMYLQNVTLAFLSKCVFENNEVVQFSATMQNRYSLLGDVSPIQFVNQSEQLCML